MELARAVPADGNRVLIGHAPNLIAAAGVTLAEGEAAVFRPDGRGAFLLVARLMPAAW